MSKGKRRQQRKKGPRSTPRAKRKAPEEGTPSRGTRRFLDPGRVPPRRVLGFLSLVVLVAIISLGLKTLLFSQRGELTIAYPFDGSVFPPEIIPPNVWWEGGGSDADAWHVAVDFASGHDPIEVDVDTTLWAPSDALWDTIKAESLGTEARITVSSLVTFAGIRRTLSSQTIAISTSPDSVDAPIFFRDVPLPFLFANVNLRMVKWRLGDIGSHERPPVVLEDMPSCGNCHSFSADGQTLGMDVDVANDKGA
jgi:hypothetical protein